MTDDAQMFNDERLTPHRAVHPGEILREELRERGISTDDFARRLGMSSRNLHNFLRGDLPLSKVDVDKYGVTASQPMEQREQKPNLFGLCRVATEEDYSQYGIQSVPTLMLFRRGEVLWRTSGVVQKVAITQ